MGEPNDIEQARKDGEFQGRLLNRLDNLETAWKEARVSLDDHKKIMGERTGKQELDISKINGQMDIVLLIGKWIFGPIFGSAGLAAVVGVAWWLLHK